MERNEVFAYVKKQYGTAPEYLWKADPYSAVCRHRNGKWYAVLMRIQKSKLGFAEDTMTDILNVKCEPDMAAMVTQSAGFLPGYHMNKRYWITILLDGTVEKEKVLEFLDRSYEIIDGY